MPYFNNAEGSKYIEFHDDDDVEHLQCIQFVKHKMYLMSSKKIHKNGKEEIKYKYFDMEDQKEQNNQEDDFMADYENDKMVNSLSASTL